MTQILELSNLSVITPRLPYICYGGGQNENLPRTITLLAAAAIATIAILIAAWHHPIAHADDGATVRIQTAAIAPDDSGATIQAHAQRILRALTNRDANNWVRYWQARAACDAGGAHDATPRSRALFALTTALCAQLDALLSVNPAAYPPRGAGLLLNEPRAAVGYTLFTLWDNASAHKVYLIDPLGRIAHTWHLEDTPSVNHAELLDNGNLMEKTGDKMTDIDPRGNIVWQSKSRRFHHDFLKMPNGNALMLVQALKTREEAIAAGANPEFVGETGILYDYLLEVRPTGKTGGEVVWEWSVWDHLIQDFDPTKPNYGAIPEHPERIDLNFLLETLNKSHRDSELTHINAIDYNPELDQIMLSSRHYSELWIIDHSATTEEASGNAGIGGDLLYRWGNPRAYRHGDDDQRLLWQHQTHWIPPGLPGAGNILAFNNGLEFSGYRRGYSSVDEIAPPVDIYRYRYRRDEDAAYPPNELEWTYAAETPADF